MREHGSFTLELDKHILILRAFGAWNYETAHRCIKEIKMLINNVDNTWLCLIDLSRWELGTPEVWEEFNKLYHWRNNGNNNIEIIISSCALQRYLMKKSKADHISIKTMFFQHTDEAMRCLDQLRTGEKTFTLEYLN